MYAGFKDETQVIIPIKTQFEQLRFVFRYHIYVSVAPLPAAILLFFNSDMMMGPL